MVWMKLAYLMIREYEGVSEHNVLSPASSKHDHLGDIIWSQRLTACIDRIGLGLVSTKSNNGKLL